MQVRFVDIDGIRTRCLIAGDPKAYPLLLLHGYGGTADIWNRNIDELGRDFFVVAPDLISCGFTDIVDLGPVMPQPAAVVHMRGLVDHFGWDKLCAMGTSYGSQIAALLYFDMPGRVDRLVINGSANCFNSEDDVVMAMEKVRTGFGPLLDNPTVDGCRRSMQRQLFDPSKVMEEILLTMATAYARPGIKKAWADGIDGVIANRASRQVRILHRLEAMDVETLVVWGRQDPGALWASAAAAVPRLPRAEFVTFEDCGHKPMFEHTERYNDLMRHFLSRG